jgi:hypothetical protein
MNIKEHFKKADSEEIRFYKEILYPLQDKIFTIVSIYDDKIYLTGGTALSRFFFQHRFSDDLDFFTTTDDLKLIANDLIARLHDRGYRINKTNLDIYFARTFIEKDDVQIKLEFVKEYNRFGESIHTQKGVYINNLEDIGGNKITAFEDRAEVKDIVDLYYIIISLERLFEIADTKRVPVPYEELLTLNTEGISGRALICQDIDLRDVQHFIEKLKEETERQIKKKEEIALNNISKIVERILWDFPRHERRFNKFSQPVLKRRLKTLPLPERRAIQRVVYGE